MPTPNVYAGGQVPPFAELPPALQNNQVDVLYVARSGQRFRTTVLRQEVGLSLLFRPVPEAPPQLDEVSGYIEANGGNFDHMNLNGAINIPLVEGKAATAALRIACALSGAALKAAAMT